MKKMISVLMILVLLFSAASVLFSCGNESNEDKKEQSNGADLNNASDNGGATTESMVGNNKSYTADYLPDEDFGGHVFRIFTAVIDAAFFADVETATGDTLDDAYYKRNRLIENRYNIVFKQISVPDWPELSPAFRKSVDAASDDFDLCMLISRDAWATALTGAMQRIDNLPYVDITQPWYSQYVNSEISINGKNYFAYSDECLNMFAQTSAVLFNKQMASDLGLEDMYDLVKNDKWTIDKYFELAKAGIKDVDGDGAIGDKDIHGIISRDDMLFPTFWVSSGIKTVSKDENDLLVFTGANEKFYNILEKVQNNIYGTEGMFFTEVTGEKFAANEGLFYSMYIAVIPQLRAMDTDFGVLPFPKADENQEKYYSRVIDGWINCVPVHAPNLERTSIIMEALAVESKNITVPAYIDIVLRTKHVRDDKSQEMLDIIHANMTMDLGDTFYMDSVRNTYVTTMKSKQNTFASAVEKRTDTINKTLQKANDAALALD